MLLLITAGAVAVYRDDGGTPTRVRTTTPILRNAFALAELARLDPRSDVAEFRISCGWYYAPRRKLRAGLWKVRLEGLTFGWETNQANPGAGHVESISLTTWKRRAINGWSGTLRLRRGTGTLSNGPTTDICAGVSG